MVGHLKTCRRSCLLFSLLPVGQGKTTGKTTKENRENNRGKQQEKQGKQQGKQQLDRELQCVRCTLEMACSALYSKSDSDPEHIMLAVHLMLLMAPVSLST